MHDWPEDVWSIGFSGKLIPLKRGGSCRRGCCAPARRAAAGLLLIVGDGPSRAAPGTGAFTPAQVDAVCGIQKSVGAGCLVRAWTYSCFPSRSETWGLVLNEAMLFQLPVIASSMVGATEDLIDTGKNGYVFDVGDVARLTDALRTLVHSAKIVAVSLAFTPGNRREYSHDVCLRGTLDALGHVTAGVHGSAGAREQRNDTLSAGRNGVRDIHAHGAHQRSRVRSLAHERQQYSSGTAVSTARPRRTDWISAVALADFSMRCDRSATRVPRVST